MENNELEAREELNRYLEPLTRIEREVHELIFRELAEQKGNGDRLDWLMGKVVNELGYNGEMAVTACQRLEEHGFVKGGTTLFGTLYEVEIGKIKIGEAKIGEVETVEIRIGEVEHSVKIVNIWIIPTPKLRPHLGL